MDISTLRASAQAASSGWFSRYFGKIYIFNNKYGEMHIDSGRGYFRLCYSSKSFKFVFLHLERTTGRKKQRDASAFLHAESWSAEPPWMFQRLGDIILKSVTNSNSPTCLVSGKQTKRRKQTQVAPMVLAFFCFLKSAFFPGTDPGESGRNVSDERSVWFGMKLRPAPQGEELRRKTCEIIGDKGGGDSLVWSFIFINFFAIHFLFIWNYLNNFTS